MLKTDVIVVGAGAIGLSVAYHLACAGKRVTALDNNAHGQASAAAAGMLAPLAESTKCNLLVPYAIESLLSWPAFVSRLQQDALVELTIDGPGMLRIARTDGEEADLRSAYSWQHKIGLPLEELDQSIIRLLEPQLTRSAQYATLSPLEKHVEPRLLLRALKRACDSRDVVTIFGGVHSFETKGTAITAVVTKDGIFEAEDFIISGGAWTPALLDPFGYVAPIAPVKGQAAILSPLVSTLLQHTIYTPGAYLVPRLSGHVFAGASEEHVGFDAETERSVIQLLIEMAANLVPSLCEMPFRQAVAGLRPVTPDCLPIISRVPGWENLIVASGHGRNGILLTPITGKLVAEHLAGGAPLPEAFSAARFERV